VNTDLVRPYPIPESHADSVLVFLHLPKTAGQSFRRLLIDRSARDGVADVNDWDDYQEFLRSGASRRVAAIVGHMPYGIHERLDGRTATYFTMLRHPVDRFVSDYHYIVSIPDHPWNRKFDSREFTLEDYVNLSEDHYIAFNAMTRRLCSYDLDYAYTPQVEDRKYWWETHRTLTQRDLNEAMTNLRDRIRHFGIFEEMEISLAYFRSLIDLPPDCGLPRENVSPTKTPLTSIPAELYEQIVQRNILDVELYYWAVDEFHRRFTAAGFGGV